MSHPDHCVPPVVLSGRLSAIAAALVTALLMLSSSGARSVTPEAPANAWEQPPLVLEGLDGETHSLTEWRGSVILLNFWASWCAPCQYEIPDLVRWQREFADSGLQVVGVGIDEARPLRNVSRSLQINYPVLIARPETSRRLLALWGNPQQMVPYSVLIGRDGTILTQYRGALDDEVFGEFILPTLQMAPPPVLAGAKSAPGGN